MPSLKPSFSYSSKLFGYWRFAFGFFLTFYYIRLFPYAAELFSRDGAFPDLVNRAGFLLRVFQSAHAAQAIVLGCIASSALIMLGWGRRVAAFVLWLLVCWLYNRNLYTHSPDYEFVNWLIFALIVIPEGEEFSFGKIKSDWTMPKEIYWGAWIVLAVGYFCAGVNKLRFHDTSWWDGSALYYVLTTDNTRLGWYGHVLDQIQPIYFRPLTWGTLVLQIGSPILASMRFTRFAWWVGMTAMHVFILMFINLPEVTVGMLFFHVFLWNREWLRKPQALRPS